MSNKKNKKVMEPSGQDKKIEEFIHRFIKRYKKALLALAKR